jgi:hypothetical protein
MGKSELRPINTVQGGGIFQIKGGLGQLHDYIQICVDAVI